MNRQQNGRRQRASASASAAGAPAQPKLGLTWLLSIAVLLPGTIALLNYVLMGSILSSRGQIVGACGLFAWYVVQVGLVGWVIGRELNSPFLRWTIFGWILLLIYFQSLSLAFHASAEQFLAWMAPAALLSGQLGLAIVWGLLGDGRWPMRWAAMVSLVAALPALRAGVDPAYDWSDLGTQLMFLQSAVLFLFCAALRLRGFRLGLQERLAGEASRRELSLTQFGIRDVLVWTSVLALLLGLARWLDRPSLSAVRVFQTGLGWKLIVATTAAATIVVAVWAALGRGHWLSRSAIGLLLVVLAGVVLSSWSVANLLALDAQTARGRWAFRYWELRQSYEIGYWWLGWLFLSGGLLAATLIILRVLGYRLVRLRRA